MEGGTGEHAERIGAGTVTGGSHSGSHSGVVEEGKERQEKILTENSQHCHGVFFFFFFANRNITQRQL